MVGRNRGCIKGRCTEDNGTLKDRDQKEEKPPTESVGPCSCALIWRILFCFSFNQRNPSESGNRVGCEQPGRPR